MEKFLKSQRMERMEITIADAKPILREIEMEKRLNLDQITKDAIMVIKVFIPHFVLISSSLCRVFSKFVLLDNHKFGCSM